MKPERTYHSIGRYAIAFDVSVFIIRPGECCDFPETNLPSVHGAHYKVVSAMRELYERMLADERVCTLQVSVSRPLSRQQADRLNENKITIASLVGLIVARGAGWVMPKVSGKLAKGAVGGVSGSAAALATRKALTPYHAGDVMVVLQAEVKGGIGPQVSTTMLII